MKLDKDTCLGAKINGKEVTEIKLNGHFLYESEWPDDLNVYTIHMPPSDNDNRTNPFPFYLSEKEGNYENSYPLYVDWGNAHIMNPLPGYPEPSDTLVYIYWPPEGTTFNIKTNYEVVNSNQVGFSKSHFISDIVSIRRDTTSLESKFEEYAGKNIRESVLEKLSHVKSDNMSNTFSSCNNLISLDVSYFDTSNVTNMNMMFFACSSLTSLDVSSFNTSNVTNMKYMFSCCSSLTSLDISNFDTSNVTDFYSMFDGCSSLKSLNASNLKVGYLADARQLFDHCRKLEYLDLSNASINYYAWTGTSLDYCDSLRTIRFDNCSSTTINKLIKTTSSYFPTGTINGETRKIWCRRSAAKNVTLPEGWDFVYVD